ncbi:MAG: hypothetical protein V7731_16095 [Amphritea sp.]
MVDKQVLKSAAQKQAAVVLPAGKAVAKKKPAEIKARLSYQMIYECCGNAPDINMHEQEQRCRVFFKDDSTLLVMLQEAITEADKQFCPVEVEGLPGALVYLPAQQRFMFDFPEELLIPLALTRFGYQELSLNSRPDISEDTSSLIDANIKSERGDELLWKVAFWTSKGRLNKCIDPDKRCQLATELDFNRLLATPHATTINSLWRRHSLSVLEVVKVLKINQRYVFSFMSAAQALGVFK